jgi:signal peptidase II
MCTNAGKMRTRYYLITLFIVILDHWTKWWLNTRLAADPIELISGYLRLSLVHNNGVAFGLFSGEISSWKPYLLAGMAVVALVCLILYSRQMPAARRLLQVGLASTMGGIVGNLLDRVFRGYVVDFIECHIHESYYWPNFNVADSAISIGIALLLIDTVFAPGADATAADPANGRS